MIHIASFDEFMTFNERSQTLRGGTGRVFAVGDKIKVILAGINTDEHKIELFPDTRENRIMIQSTAGKKKTRNKKTQEKAKVIKKAVDKDAFFKSIADITRNQAATAEDAVLREEEKPKKNLPLTQEFGDEMLLAGSENHKKHGKRHKKKAKSQKSASGSKNGKKKRKK